MRCRKIKTERTRPQAPEAPFRRCIGVDVYVYEQTRLRRQPFPPRFLGDGRETSSARPCHDPCRRRFQGRGPRTPSEFCHHLAMTRCRARFRDSASGSRRKLVRTSSTFPGLPLLRVSRNVVRAMITEAPIACQNHASVVAVLERAILTVPIHTTSVDLDHRAPRSIGALRLSWTEAYRCQSSGSHQNRADHHLSTSIQALVITPRRLSLFQ